MNKRLLAFILLAVMASALWGCAPAPAATSEIKAPTVNLARVEAVGVFPLPWAGWPAQPPAPTPAFNVVPRFPITLAFVFDLENPNDVAVMFEQMKFAVELEAKPDAPGEYFGLGVANVYDRQSIPAKTTNTLRATVVLDSGLTSVLGIAYGQKIAEKKLDPNKLVNYWWDKVQDISSATPAYGIKVTGGAAEFSGGATRKQVTFEGKWPK
jgi:hypothetical protein